MKALLQRVVRALSVVIHDTEVQRSGKSFALLIGVRLALALGASVVYVDMFKSLAEKLLGL